MLHKPLHSSGSDFGQITSGGSSDTDQIQHAATAVRTIAVVPARYVLLWLAAAITGYTVKAMQRKIERGDWPEGRLWIRAPDGRILLDMTGYDKWVEGR